MRLIDADALKNTIPKAEVDGFQNCRYCSLLDDIQVKNLIDNAPTIEGAENEGRIRNSVNLLRALLIQSQDKDITVNHDIIKMLYETLKSCLSN